MPAKGDLIRYVRRKDLPQGWLARTDAEILQVVMEAQCAAGLTGSAAEIGVHHGRSMIAICLGLADNEKAYAIDIFDQQHLNKDGSGRGNRDIFEKNLVKFGVAPDAIVIDPRPSDEVKPQDILEAVGPARIFSVDGGHWTSIVQSDLRLAEASIAPHGVIALDDFHRLEWPEVSAGYFAWFGERDKAGGPLRNGIQQTLSLPAAAGSILPTGSGGKPISKALSRQRGGVPGREDAGLSPDAFSRHGSPDQADPLPDDLSSGFLHARRGLKARRRPQGGRFEWCGQEGCHIYCFSMGSNKVRHLKAPLKSNGNSPQCPHL